MKKIFFTVIAIAGILLLSGCPDPTAAFSYSAGASVAHLANSMIFNMHYIPSGGPFTMGEDVQTTTQEVTLTKNFWMGETRLHRAYGKMYGEPPGRGQTRTEAGMVPGQITLPTMLTGMKRRLSVISLPRQMTA